MWYALYSFYGDLIGFLSPYAMKHTTYPEVLEDIIAVPVVDGILDVVPDEVELIFNEMGDWEGFAKEIPALFTDKAVIY